MYKLDEFVIDEIDPNEEWYYYAFWYYDLIPLYNYGMLCSKELGKKSNGNGGSYYVSVSKQDLYPNSLYKKFDHTGASMFILDDLYPFNTHNNYFAKIVKNTPIPYRYSPYDTEYQVYKNIDRSHIVGIRAMSIDNKKELVILKQMLLEMKLYGINLPVYDYSLEKINVIRELDKEKILKKV